MIQDNNPHIGSNFDDFLKKEGLYTEVNANAAHAMKVLQTAMQGEAEKAGIKSDEDVLAIIAEMRTEEQRLFVLDDEHGQKFQELLDRPVQDKPALKALLTDRG